MPETASGSARRSSKRGLSLTADFTLMSDAFRRILDVEEGATGFELDGLVNPPHLQSTDGWTAASGKRRSKQPHFIRDPCGSGLARARLPPFAQYELEVSLASTTPSPLVSSFANMRSPEALNSARVRLPSLSVSSTPKRT